MTLSVTAALNCLRHSCVRSPAHPAWQYSWPYLQVWTGTQQEVELLSGGINQLCLGYRGAVRGKEGAYVAVKTEDVLGLAPRDVDDSGPIP